MRGVVQRVEVDQDQGSGGGVALPSPAPGHLDPRRGYGLPVAVGLAILGASILSSLMISGTTVLSPAEVWSAIAGEADAQTRAVVVSLRLPRTVVAILVGACLAVAGGLIQGVTRNPIVEPSIIGVNSGAAFAVALVTMTIGVDALTVGRVSLVPFVAFVGAAGAAGLVYGMVGVVGATPGRIALAGVTVAILANALVTTVILLNNNVVSYLLRFLVGGVDGSSWTSVVTLLPYSIVGLTAAVAISRSVTVLSLGDDVARGLGQRVQRIRLVAIALVVVLAGSAVAVAGPIAMVGLIVPHVTYWMVGHDYRKALPLCMILGAALLVGSDVAARILAPPTETPVGVLTALIGTPFFIYLARRGRGAI